MNVTATAARSILCRPVIAVLVCALTVGIELLAPGAAEAQEPGPQPALSDGRVASDQAAAVAQGLQAAEAELAARDGPRDGARADGDEGQAGAAPEVEAQINILDLMLAGGHLMWPILAMSLLVVTFGVERWLGLRRRRVLPPDLISGLGKLVSQKGGFDPRRAYRLCQQYPSAAANVIKTMLLKVGRPHAEVEHTVTEANEREAARLYVNVRWLSLAAGVTPLMGLLGTVWGMIQAFFATANLPTGANKAEHLADGIYTALVTTFAGLAVAIPAAVLAHFFEGRIQRLFRELDETLLGLMPQLERFEGRLRVSKDQLDKPAKDGQGRDTRETPAGEPGPPRPAATPK